MTQQTDIEALGEANDARTIALYAELKSLHSQNAELRDKLQQVLAIVGENYGNATMMHLHIADWAGKFRATGETQEVKEQG